MPEPAEYLADSTAGFTRVEDVPEADVVEGDHIYARRPCPRCQRSCYRKRTVQRTLHDVGALISRRPRNIQLTYSQDY